MNACVVLAAETDRQAGHLKLVGKVRGRSICVSTLLSKRVMAEIL
jgi:hypothetical protein